MIPVLVSPAHPGANVNDVIDDAGIDRASGTSILFGVDVTVTALNA